MLIPKSYKPFRRESFQKDGNKIVKNGHTNDK